MVVVVWWQAHEEHVDETSWIGYIAITKDGQTHLGKTTTTTTKSESHAFRWGGVGWFAVRRWLLLMMIMMMMMVVVGDQKPVGVTGGNSGSGSLRGVGATGSGIGGVAV